MYDMTILESVRAENARERSDNLAWQQRQVALAEDRHQELRRDAKAAGSMTRAIAIIAAAISALSAIAAWIGVMK